MKTLIVILLLQMGSLAMAFDHSMNPDRYPSFGFDVSGGKLPGMQKDNQAIGTLLSSASGIQGAPSSDGGFVKGSLDIRVPISNVLTLHAFGSSTSVNNNMQFSDGHEVGIGMRVYLQ